LIEEVVVGAVADHPVLAGDDAGGDRVAQAEGAADGDHPVADLQLVGVAQVDRGQLALGGNLQERHVGLLVAADHLGRIGPLVGQLHPDLGGVVHHVVVGEDVAVRADDEARAQRGILALLALESEELLQERIVVEGIAPEARRDGLGGVDVDHRGLQLLYQAGERGQRAVAPREHHLRLLGALLPQGLVGLCGENSKNNDKVGNGMGEFHGLFLLRDILIQTTILIGNPFPLTIVGGC